MYYFKCGREQSWLAFSSCDRATSATELLLRVHVNVPQFLNRNLAHSCGSSIVLFNFTDDCDVDGFTYKDGEPFYIPQNPIIDYSDIGCQTCSCNRGETTCQGKVKCDMFTQAPCEKLIPAPQGKCCPTCGKFYVKSKTLVKR